MNHSYLMKYISYHLHTFVRKYSLQKELLESFCARTQFDDRLVTSDVSSLFSDLWKIASAPILASSSQQITYALIPTPEHLFIVGPVCFIEPVYLPHTFETNTLDQSLLASIPRCTFENFMNDVLLAYNLYQESPLDKSTFLLSNFISPEADQNLQKHFSELVFQNREYGKSHNPYDQELREFSSIEHGDLEQLKRSHEEDYTGEVGQLAKDPLRQAKNISIVLITLASRAAIRGGLLPEVSFSLSDSYIQKIEECNDIPALFHLSRGAEFQYAQMVKDIIEQKKGLQNKNPNPHINKCKDYIFAHLHDKILITDIADELQINANYLSELFHKCEKMSLTEFIRNEKIKLAKNLLVYSQYTYIEIASYLGFSSQSHLGKQFKHVTGYTLKQYRQEFGMKEFTDDN